jgi:hypothetical protein
MALVTLDQARRHLKMPPTLNDPVLEETVERASAIVVAFLTSPDDAWTEWTAPVIVQAAVLAQLADMYIHRGDERAHYAALDRREGGGICTDAEAILRATGYRDPVLA